jgi:hypothetical protein
MIMANYTAGARSISYKSDEPLLDWICPKVKNRRLY